MKTEDQIRHEAIIEFIGTLNRYHKRDGAPLLKAVPHARFSKDCEKIDTRDIHEATLLLQDVLNIRKTSTDTLRLQHMLEAYFKVQDYRGKLDDLAREALMANEAMTR